MSNKECPMSKDLIIEQSLLNIRYWFSLSKRPLVVFQAFRALAHGAQVFKGVDANIVAIAPGNLVGIVADGRHAYRLKGHQLAGLEEAQRVGRLSPSGETTSAGTRRPQMFPGVSAVMAVVPVDGQAVGVQPPQGQRPERWVGGIIHGGTPGRVLTNSYYTDVRRS